MGEAEEGGYSACHREELSCRVGSKQNKMPPKARPPGTGRKARAKRRREELAAGGQLLSAVAYHGHTAPSRLRLLNLFLKLSLAPELFIDNPEGTAEPRGERGSGVSGASQGSNGAGGATPVVMDIGFGDEPTTTVELQGLLATKVQIVATEADRERLDRAEAAQHNELAQHGTALSAITKKPIRFCQTGTDFALPPLQVTNSGLHHHIAFTYPNSTCRAFAPERERMHLRLQTLPMQFADNHSVILACAVPIIRRVRCFAS